MPKQGLAYYTIDTNRYQDRRIKRLKKAFSVAGIAVYDYILCEIYRVQGCFLEWDSDTAFDVAEYFGIKESTVTEIVKYCAAAGLFHKELLSRGIITSPSIQQRYIDMCRRAKRTNITIRDDVRLLDKATTENVFPEEMPKLPEEMPKLPEEMPKLPEVSGQSKEKKSISPPIVPPLQGGDEEDFFHLSSQKEKKEACATPSAATVAATAAPAHERPAPDSRGGQPHPNPLSAHDGVPRNYPGLLDAMRDLGITGREADQIASLTDYGRIGHPVWPLIIQCRESLRKRADDPSRIKFPARFILKQLRQDRPRQ